MEVGQGGRKEGGGREGKGGREGVGRWVGGREEGREGVGGFLGGREEGTGEGRVAWQRKVREKRAREKERLGTPGHGVKAAVKRNPWAGDAEGPCGGGYNGEARRMGTAEGPRGERV